jgi:hypothetical protein
MRIEIASPRPLADVALALEKNFQRILTYEEAPYSYSGDITQDEAGRTVPRAGRIELDYGPEDTLEVVIQNAVKAHSRAGNPGVFEVRRQNEHFHVVPRVFRNEAGTTEEWLPLLDTSVTFDQAGENALEHVEHMLRSVSLSRRMSVVLGTVPTNALVQHRSLDQSYQNREARSLLLDLFRGMPTPLSWHLLNQPATREFVLNIHPVGSSERRS